MPPEPQRPPGVPKQHLEASKRAFRATKRPLKGPQKAPTVPKAPITSHFSPKQAQILQKPQNHRLWQHHIPRHKSTTLLPHFFYFKSRLITARCTNSKGPSTRFSQFPPHFTSTQPWAGRHPTGCGLSRFCPQGHVTIFQHDTRAPAGTPISPLKRSPVSNPQPHSLTPPPPPRSATGARRDAPIAARRGSRRGAGRCGSE